MNTEIKEITDDNNVFKFIKIRIVYNPGWRNSEDDYRPAYSGPNKVKIDNGDVALCKDPQDRNIIFIGTKIGVLVLYQIKVFGNLEWKTASNAHVTKFLGLKGKAITEKEVIRLISIASEEIDEMLDIASHYVNRLVSSSTYTGRGS